jgi:hypothetical protein
MKTRVDGGLPRVVPLFELCFFPYGTWCRLFPEGFGFSPPPQQRRTHHTSLPPSRAKLLLVQSGVVSRGSPRFHRAANGRIASVTHKLRHLAAVLKWLSDVALSDGRMAEARRLCTRREPPGAAAAPRGEATTPLDWMCVASIQARITNIV